MELITGGLLIVAGYFLCYFTQKSPKKTTETKIKRAKPSLRNPLKTYKVEYDIYKSTDSNLYAPKKHRREVK